jgi:protoporphyrin/coproporphyrin ferrochelatase
MTRAVLLNSRSGIPKKPDGCYLCAMADSRRGVILMNLGSPDSTGVKDVKKYLTEFLLDKRVIDYPWLLRKMLVQGVIVPFRAPKSAEAYRTIWTKDGSPLVVFTRELGSRVQDRLASPVSVGMRYGNPSMEQAFEELIKQRPDIEEVIAVPLYPHYAMSSYETAVEHARAVHSKKNYRFGLRFVPPYYNHPDYIRALTEHVRPYLNLDYDHLLFSYHGIPERHLRKTDPTGNHCLRSADCCSVNSAAHARCYRHQCLQTMNLVAQQLDIPLGKFSYSFQSRLGKEEWLKPYTDFRFMEMPREGIKKLLVICPAFVSDCLETLEEIAIRGKRSFLESGGEAFTMIPCLNLDDLWVKALAGWVSQ